jgi:hypothetical protein
VAAGRAVRNRPPVQKLLYQNFRRHPVADSSAERKSIAASRDGPHISSVGRRLEQTAGRSGFPKSAQRKSGSNCTQGTPAGLPCGIPGIGDEMLGAMQHAPQPLRQFIRRTSTRPAARSSWRQEEEDEGRGTRLDRIYRMQIILGPGFSTGWTGSEESRRNEILLSSASLRPRVFAFNQEPDLHLDRIYRMHIIFGAGFFAPSRLCV